MGNIIRFHPEPDTWQPSHQTPQAAFSTEDKSERHHPYYTSENEDLVTGVWECAPSIMEIDSYPVHEMMTLLSGSVTITDHDNGRSDTFTAGDTFLVAKGSRITWQITETLRKYYFIVT